MHKKDLSLKLTNQLIAIEQYSETAIAFFFIFYFFIDAAKHLLTILTETQNLQDLQDFYSTITTMFTVHSGILCAVYNLFNCVILEEKKIQEKVNKEKDLHRNLRRLS